MSTFTGDEPLAAARIRDARADIARTFLNSPQFVSDALSGRLGGPVLLKLETLNPIRSFKGRGTWLAVSSLFAQGDVGPDRGIATVTTGNFGLGVSYAARAHGIPATVFLPEWANPRKVASLERLGVNVRLIPGPVENVREALARASGDQGLYPLVDGHDSRIALGAGTIALEVSEAVDRGDLPAVDVAYIPVGDGSLIAGIGTWLRAASPSTRIVGVGVEHAPAMALSWRSGRVVNVAAGPTAADGIGGSSGNEDLLPTLRSVVDDMVLLSEDVVHEAQLELLDAVGIISEASGAASWAAARAGGTSAACSLVLVTGSNERPSEFQIPRNPGQAG